jgi:hypothetical protein
MLAASALPMSESIFVSNLLVKAPSVKARLLVGSLLFEYYCIQVADYFVAGVLATPRYFYRDGNLYILLAIPYIQKNSLVKEGLTIENTRNLGVTITPV